MVVGSIPISHPITYAVCAQFYPRFYPLPEHHSEHHSEHHLVSTLACGKLFMRGFGARANQLQIGYHNFLTTNQRASYELSRENKGHPRKKSNDNFSVSAIELAELIIHRASGDFWQAIYVGFSSAFIGEKLVAWAQHEGLSAEISSGGFTTYVCISWGLRSSIFTKLDAVMKTDGSLEILNEPDK